MGDILLTSCLASAYTEALENLLFFNSHQSRVSDQITRAVADFGLPKIVDEAGRLRIRLANLDDTQSLYALEEATPQPVLIGLLVYYRRSLTEVMVIHLALNEEYLAETGRTGDDVLVDLLQQFQEQLKRVKGVETLSFCYTPSRFRIH